MPKSPAFEMGLESGDKILEINGSEVSKEDEIMNQLRNFTNFVELKVKKSNNSIKELSYNHLNNTKRFGIVFVPRTLPKGSTIVKLEDNKFQDILDKIKKKNKDD
jgi:C-terminal processing protease CtpA/Prc